MKYSSLMAFFAVAASLLAGGCVATQTIETHILDARLDGAPTQIPIHVTTPQTSGTITVTPYAGLRATPRITGEVEGSPVSDGAPFYPANQVPDHNLAWNFPAFTAGIDLDVAMQSTAFSFGANYSASNGSTRGGFLAGFGLFNPHPGNIAVRFDGGVTMQGVSSRVASVVVTTTTFNFFGTSTSTDTAFYLDTKTELRFGYFASLTFNTTSESSPVNFVLQTAFQHQTLFDFVPYQRVTRQWMVSDPVVVESQSSDGKASTTATFFSLAPALAVELAPDMRLVAGARVFIPIMEKTVSPGTLILPFIRMDILFR